MLNSISEPRLGVNQRSVRHHFKTLMDNFKGKIRAEDRALGISPEESETDIALQDIVERFERSGTFKGRNN